MIINGREVHFFYSVGARCDFEDYIILHSGKIGTTRAMVAKAVAMNKAYILREGSNEEPLKESEIMSMPEGKMKELIAEIDACEKRDSKRTVEIAEPKGKNAESAAERI